MFIVLIVGTVFFLVGSYFIYNTYTFRKNADRIIGKVVGYEKEYRKRTNNSSGGTYYYVVVEYVYVNRYRFKGDIGSSMMSYDIGDEVEVLIMNGDHATARIKRPARVILGAAFTGMGLIALGVFFSQYESSNESLFSWVFILPVLLIPVYIFYKTKKKINQLGVHSLTELQAKMKEHSPQHAGNPLEKGEDGIFGYQPSPDFISTQSEVKYSSQNVYLITLVIGLVVFGAGYYYGKERYDFIQTAPSVIGTVIDMKQSRSDDSYVYYPVLEYFVHGKRYTFKHNVGSSHPFVKVGDHVSVYYNENNINDALMDDGWINYAWQGGLAVLGLLMILSGTYNTFIKKRRRG